MRDFVLNIPEDDFADLLEVLKLDQDELDDVISKINLLDVDINLQNVEDKLKNITPKYSIILGLFYLFGKYDLDEENFINRLYEYYKSKEENFIEFDKFKRKIVPIFNENSPVRISVKAVALKGENRCLYEDSRILSDIRPVFCSKTKEKIVGKVILHQLRISYKENDLIKENYISLDINDLKELKSVIERAERKHDILMNIKLS